MKKGLMDTIVEELNANLPDGEKVERMYNDPTIIDNSGREHSLNGKFAKTTKAAPKTPKTVNHKRKPVTKKIEEVTLMTFTGMKIGSYKVTAETDTEVSIVTNKGTLTFDKTTLRQTNSTNPKFANKISF